MFKCQSCQMAKMTKAAKTKIDNRPASRKGERFHMDFGFFRGPKHLQDLTKRKHVGKRRAKGEETPDYQPIVTSHDGFSSYLLIVDAFTRASWVFLTRTKNPPIETLKMFLKTYGLKDKTQRYVRTDQGGELARSEEFRRTIMTAG